MAFKLVFFFFLSIIADWAAATNLEEIVVVASKTQKTIGETAGSISVLSNEDVTGVAHVHINELLQRSPGVWISRGYLVFWFCCVSF